MTIVWCGTLAVLLNRLSNNLFKVDKYTNSVEERVKRIGVYYMCIDDLPL